MAEGLCGSELVQGLGRLQQLLGVARDFHFAPDPADHALLVDEEGGTLDGHIFPAIHALFHPGAVGPAHFAVLIGDEREVRSNFFLNLSWLSTESREMPTIAAFTLEKSGRESRKAQASAVQPEVSSLG